MNEKIIDLIRPILGDDVSESTAMANTPSWDSIRTLQIVMALDEAGISLPFERIADIHSVADIIELAGAQ